MRSKYVTVDVEVDLSDYIDVILDLCDDSDLICEIKSRHLFSSIETAVPRSTNSLTGNNLRDHLCDILNTGYLIHDNDEIIEMIKQKLNNK